MKHVTFVIAAAFAPLAIAAETGSAEPVVTATAEQLQATVPVSQLKDADVLGADGENYGDVHDVLLDSNGRVMSLLVRQEGEHGSAEARQGKGGRDSWHELFVFFYFFY